MSNVIDSVANAVNSIGEAFDKNFTSKEEVLEKVKEAQDSILEAQKTVLLAEMTGSKMQRNWRPFLMYLFGIIIAYNALIAPILFHIWEIPKPELTPDFWEVLKLAIGGYVIGRTSEKVIPGVTQAVKNFQQTRRQRRNERKN